MKSNHISLSRGFSLIELLVVIGIVAMLISVTIPNLLGARQRAKDAKRKAETNQLKSALRLYYNDYNKYPAAVSVGIGKLNYIAGCAATGAGNCPCSSTLDFAAGGAGCDNIYMKKFPSELGSSMYYYQRSSGDDFCLKVPLDNPSDPEIASSQSRCASVCTGVYSGSDYVVCAD